MVQEIVRQVHEIPQLQHYEIYIASSHTIQGGAYLNIPYVDQNLAGTYSTEITEFYIKKTVEAILQASQNQIPQRLV